MVWGCIAAAEPVAFAVFQQGKTITDERYLKVLGDNILKHMDLSHTTIFQRDSTPAHKARIVTNWSKNEAIELLL